MKVAFVIGHHNKAKGAFSPYFKLSEWDFYNLVASNIQTDVSVFIHNSEIKGYTKRVKRTAEQINKHNFDLVIEAHFNSAMPSANGVETLYFFKSQKGKEYAKLFSEVVNQHTGIKMRNNGLKALINRKDRGFASVYYTMAPTILIEPFFGSNKEDCQKIESPENMACIIDDFLFKITQ
jgi:N-acetylmuramoyl-L-alanine amidase